MSAPEEEMAWTTEKYTAAIARLSELSAGTSAAALKVDRLNADRRALLDRAAETPNSVRAKDLATVDADLANASRELELAQAAEVRAKLLADQAQVAVLHAESGHLIAAVSAAHSAVGRAAAGVRAALEHAQAALAKLGDAAFDLDVADGQARAFPGRVDEAASRNGPLRDMLPHQRPSTAGAQIGRVDAIWRTAAVKIVDPRYDEPLSLERLIATFPCSSTRNEERTR
jgi:hypothetical protein